MKNLSISMFTACSLVACAILLAGCGTGPDAKSHPDNIVIITLDTTRADYLGCYGSPVVKTPNLDAFAAGAVRFTRCYSTCNSTLPSHTSMFTSLYPRDHGVLHNKLRVPEIPWIMPSVFKSKGFATAGFTSGGSLTRMSGIDQGFDEFYDPAGAERRAGETNNILMKWLAIKGYSREKPANGLFLWVHYFDPHVAYDPPPPFDTMYNMTSSERTNIVRSHVVNNVVNHVYGESEFDPEQVRNLYRGEVSYMDAEFGRLISLLKSTGLYDNTLIVVLADHGESLGDHGIYWNHAGLYDTTVHVPLMVKPAGSFTPGTRDQLVSTTDLYPTIMDMAGIAAAPGSSGTSLTGIIGDMSSSEIHDDVYFQSIHEGQLGVKTPKYTYIRNVMTGVAGDGRRIIQDPAGQAELYVNDTDPSQTTDVLADSPDASIRMNSVAMSFITDRGSHIKASEITDTEQIKKLKALGYLQ